MSSESTEPDVVHPLDEGAAGADGDLRKLRGLLIGPELDEIAALRHRLDDPQERTLDVSAHLAEAIAIRAKKKDGKLQTALQPLLEESLRISVQRDPEILSTALFPIIGEAVRKAVAHALQGMFDSLNLMLNRGFSVESWKWRFEAWRTGKSFAQIVVTRSLTYRVEQVFLIHRETGLLAGQASFDDGVVQDADLISGMFTAVQDFVRDSFGRKKTDDLEFMEIGVYKIWLLQGPLALLAPVVSGQPPPELREVFERELEAIHKDFGEALKDFNGDTSTVSGVEANLRRCLLGAQKKVAARRSHASLWIVFALLLLGIVALAGLRIRDNLRWDHYVARLRTEPGIVVVDSKRHWFGYAVNGLRDPLAIGPRSLLSEYHLPDEKVSEHWEPYLSLDPAFAAARRVETEKAAVERQIIRFDVNSAQLPMSQFDILDAVAQSINTLRETALENHQLIGIRIEGHTDQKGEQSHNMQLSEQRAQMVAKLLETRGIGADILSAAGVADSRPEHSGREVYPLELDRRVTFEVALTPAPAAATGATQ